jgi:hypothetical protein
MAVNINVPSQVKTYADLAAFPASGALKTIYIAEDTNKTYRWTGSVYVEVSAAGASGITIGTTAITSGTVGRVLFEGTGNVVQESANLFWDETNGRLGIGTNAPSGKIHVKGSVASEIFKAESTIAALYAQFVSTDGAGEFGIYTDAFYFQPLPSLANGTRFLNGGNTIIMQLAQTGNVGIGTTTDAGYKLDVNGTARVSGNATISLNQNAATQINISNTTSGSSASPILNLTSDVASGIFQFGKQSTLTNVYKTIGVKDGFIYNGSTGGDISILNDFATGRIKFAAGGVSTAQATLFSTGNFAINTTTDNGYKLDVNGTLAEI